MAKENLLLSVPQLPLKAQATALLHPGLLAPFQGEPPNTDGLIATCQDRGDANKVMLLK